MGHTRYVRREGVMSRVMLVVGTRPEGIKMMPVYFALKKAGYNPYLCSTNQHNKLLTEVLDLFGIKPDCQLHIMEDGQDLYHINITVLERMKKVYEKEKPSCVLVQGDTTTVMAAAMAAFYKQIPVGHIEAGLRTGDKYHPFPEEINRKVLGLVADFHFAPTALAMANLLSERKERSSLFCVGNTVVDALRITRERIESGTIAVRPDIERAVAGCILSNQKTVLLTMHRRESLNGGVATVLKVVKKCAQENPDVFFFYPFHPNPLVVKAVQEVGLDTVENIFLTEPVAYKDLVYLLSNVDFVATDSGGIQEEAVSLGKKVLVLREKSERMEGVWHGYAQLVGTNAEKVEQAFKKLFAKSKPEASDTTLYGDGYAAQKIVRILERCKALSTKQEQELVVSKKAPQVLEKG
jgi:UDP-N-acetylglucosamine 2-epimerase (non-hydrolysing)